MMEARRSVSAFAAMVFFGIAIACLGDPLDAQEFRLDMAAPAEIHRNSTFEAAFQLTSLGIPAGKSGARGWTLSVAHEELEIVSATTEGTIVDELFNGGFENTEITFSDTDHPRNDGFVSAVILSLSKPIVLPPSGTVVVARATYRAGDLACALGGRIEFKNGLVGSGLAVRNEVTWENSSYSAAGSPKTYTGCVPNDYRLHLEGPGGLLEVPLGEKRRIPVAVRLGQAEATAYGWTLAAAHDPGILQIVKVSVEGTPVESLLDPTGFALFEITSGAGNSGFAAQVQLSEDLRIVLPAPDQAIAIAEYELLPVLDPARIGTTFETTLRFAASLRGSGGPVSNQVYPEGDLLKEDLKLQVRILPLPLFIRGDANGDGAVDLADALAALFYLFGGETAPCLEAANSNDDLRIDLTDALAVLEEIFLDGPALAPPYPECGADPSLPSQGCSRSACR